MRRGLGLPLALPFLLTRTRSLSVSASARREEGPRIKFRNYQPASDSVAAIAEVVPKPAVPDVQTVVGTTEIVHTNAAEEPLLNLVPKRPNWDLKRDLEPQMKRLRKMTDKAILKLIAQKVAEEQQVSDGGERVDLAAAVAKQEAAAAADEDD